MAATFNFELVTPESVQVSADAEQVQVPGSEGDFTVYVNHAPVVSTLRPGVLEAKLADGRTTRIYVRGGFCEVGPSSLTVLAEKAVNVEAMDAALVARELGSAEAELATATGDEARRAASAAIASLKGMQR